MTTATLAERLERQRHDSASGRARAALALLLRQPSIKVEAEEMTRTVRWTLAMTALGLSSAAIAQVITGSWWWALGGLLGSGMVANALASARSVSQRGGRNT